MPPIVDPKNFDTSVSPSVNFYKYANGGWLKNNPIPGDEYRWGAFSELRKKNEEMLKEILDSLVKQKDVTPGSNQQKLRDFYNTGIDEISRERQELKPIRPELDRIGQIKNTADLLQAVIRLHRMGVQVLWYPNVEADDRNSAINVFRLYQGGLGLPDRDYYLKTDEASQKIVEQYRTHLIAMFHLAGDDGMAASNKASWVMDLEMELARSSMTAVERRDAVALYNKMTVGELNALAGNIDWSAYFAGIKANALSDLIVSQPKFVERVGQLWESAPIIQWQAYLQWHLVLHTADKLHKALLEEHFAFYGKVLTGAQQLQPAWRRTLRLIDEGLGEALGQEYVARHFPATAKQRAKDMVVQLTAVFEDRINAVDWMGEETKQKAGEKLVKFTSQIGYPDKWRDYSALEIKPDAYVLNYFRAAEFEWTRLVEEIGKPVDKYEWGMTPPTVNAYNMYNFNQIVFPAGILQTPFFDPAADDAVNYGAIGVVIGHELTHGFDDQGSKFDGDGNLEDWWTPEDRRRFEEKTRRMVEQFSGYKIAGDMTVNGELTLGENIADLGGLYIAYEALQRTMAGARPGNIDGLTPEQRFFLGYAQVWRVNIHNEALRRQVLTDPHSPGEFRTNGPLSNMPEFHKAFGVKPGDPMFRAPESRPHIW